MDGLLECIRAELRIDAEPTDNVTRLPRKASPRGLCAAPTAAAV